MIRQTITNASSGNYSRRIGMPGGCRQRISTTRRRMRSSKICSMPGTVTPVVDQRVLVHEPSGAAFQSIQQLAVFHEGWTAAADAGETES